MSFFLSIFPPFVEGSHSNHVSTIQELLIYLFISQRYAPILITERFQAALDSHPVRLDSNSFQALFQQVKSVKLHL